MHWLLMILKLELFESMLKNFKSWKFYTLENKINLLVECKSYDVQINQKTIDQILIDEVTPIGIASSNDLYGASKILQEENWD